MITTALSLFPAVIPLPADNGMFNMTLNCSSLSIRISAINGILTLLTVIPLANVTFLVAALKSTPPVSKYLVVDVYDTHCLLTFS